MIVDEFWDFIISSLKYWDECKLAIKIVYYKSSFVVPGLVCFFYPCFFFFFFKDFMDSEFLFLEKKPFSVKAILTGQLSNRSMQLVICALYAKKRCMLLSYFVVSTYFVRTVCQSGEFIAFYLDLFCSTLFFENCFCYHYYLRIYSITLYIELISRF